MTRAGVADIWTGNAIWRIAPSFGCSTSVKRPRPTSWGSRTTSSSRSTGPAHTSAWWRSSTHAARGRVRKSWRSSALDPIAVGALGMLDALEILAADEPAEVRPELRLERAQRHVAAVRGLVDAVAGPPAVEPLPPELRHAAGREVGGEMRDQPGHDAVRHRDVHELPLAGLAPVVERGARSRTRPSARRRPGRRPGRRA